MLSAVNRSFLLACCLLLPVASGCNNDDEARRDYPNRPIKLIVPFAPGGGSDTFARIIKQAIDDRDLLPQRFLS